MVLRLHFKIPDLYAVASLPKRLPRGHGPDPDPDIASFIADSWPSAVSESSPTTPSSAKVRVGNLHESLTLDYASTSWALATGAGKTIPMAPRFTEFATGHGAPLDGLFVQNALTFAPARPSSVHCANCPTCPTTLPLPLRMHKPFAASLN